MFFHKQKQNLADFFKDQVVRFYLIIALIVDLIDYFLIIAKQESLLNPVILKYNTYLGVILEGNKNNLYLLPSLGFFVIVLNVVIAFSLDQFFKEATRLLLATALIFNIFLLLSIVALMLVNKV